MGRAVILVLDSFGMAGSLRPRWMRELAGPARSRWGVPPGDQPGGGPAWMKLPRYPVRLGPDSGRRIRQGRTTGILAESTAATAEHQVV